MRLRNKRFTVDQLKLLYNKKIFAINSQAAITPWYKIFNNKKKLTVEIGMGKGDFILNACKNTQFNWIAIDKEWPLFVTASNKLLKQPSALPVNLRFLVADASNLKTYFSNNSISKIYINFPDPWPKTKHQSKRLVNENFWHLYQNLLEPNGYLCLKTDQRSIFQEALKNLVIQKWKIISASQNLYHSNITIRDEQWLNHTEYERRFLSQNQPIFYLLVKPPAS